MRLVRLEIHQATAQLQSHRVQVAVRVEKEFNLPNVAKECTVLDRLRDIFEIGGAGV